MHSVPLFGLPLEILERILLLLPPADIVQMREVNSLFLDLLSGSQYLQHRIDLYAAGLVDNSQISCDLSQRRKRLRKYVDGWKSPEASGPYRFPLKYWVNMLNLRPADQDLFLARPPDSPQTIFLTRIPSSPSQGTIEEWKLELPFQNADYIASSQDDLLVAIEYDMEFIKIHLLSLLDGSPHEVPPQKVLLLNLGHDDTDTTTSQAISRSRIALAVECTSYSAAIRRKELIIWDWRTGKVVSRRSSGDPSVGDTILGISNMEFLDETWLLAASNFPGTGLLVLDTLLPEHDPRSRLILQLPRRPILGGTCSVFTRYENSPAGYPEFSVDPAQEFFIISSQKQVAYVVPAELLKRRMGSARANGRIPWDDWGKDLTTLDLLEGAVIQVVDTKVLALRPLSVFQKKRSIEMYDLSNSAQKDIQVQQVGVEQDRRCRKVLRAPTWSDRYPKGRGIPFATIPLGNKFVCTYRTSETSGEGLYLNVWEFG